MNKINYKCLMKDCPSSCCGSFDGVQKEIEPVNNIDFSCIILTPDDVNRIINSGNEKYIEKFNDDYMMKLNPDTSCCAFENGECLIHNVKPTICKAFPFYIDMFTGLCIANKKCHGCDSKEGNVNFEELKEYINAAINIYEFWIMKINKMIND